MRYRQPCILLKVYQYPSGRTSIYLLPGYELSFHFLRDSGSGQPWFHERERERKFNLSIQPALAYEDVSMLESSAKLRMAAKQ